MKPIIFENSRAVVKSEELKQKIVASGRALQEASLIVSRSLIVLSRETKLKNLSNTWKEEIYIKTLNYLVTGCFSAGVEHFKDDEVASLFMELVFKEASGLYPAPNGSDRFVEYMRMPFMDTKEAYGGQRFWEYAKDIATNPENGKLEPSFQLFASLSTTIYLTWFHIFIKDLLDSTEPFTLIENIEESFYKTIEKFYSKSEKAIKKCPDCGTKIKKGASFCTQCGEKI